MARIDGTPDDDTLTGGADADAISGLEGNDVLRGLGGDDVLIGGPGDDLVSGGPGADTASLTLLADGADRTDLGDGFDTVDLFSGGRNYGFLLTLTSREVGNGDPAESGALAGQDGGLAVRAQVGGGLSGLQPIGPVSRFDDEGVVLTATRFEDGFEITDLDDFLRYRASVVVLGASGADVLAFGSIDRPAFIVGGAGDDVLTGGDGNDALLGGPGADRLVGGGGGDVLRGGAGDDVIDGGEGADESLFDARTDGADRVNLGAGLDRLLTQGRVRVTFDPLGVGNGSPADPGGAAGRDGGLAVRLQPLDDAGAPVGLASRVDDEGIVIEASSSFGFPIEARDLVTGFVYGAFKNVVLGTGGDDALSGGTAVRTDFARGGLIVGGPGNDTLSGTGGRLVHIGGPGVDTVVLTGTSTNELNAFSLDADRNVVVFDGFRFGGPGALIGIERL